MDLSCFPAQENVLKYKVEMPTLSISAVSFASTVEQMVLSTLISSGCKQEGQPDKCRCAAKARSNAARSVTVFGDGRSETLLRKWPCHHLGTHCSSSVSYLPMLTDPEQSFENGGKGELSPILFMRLMQFFAALVQSV